MPSRIKATVLLLLVLVLGACLGFVASNLISYMGYGGSPQIPSSVETILHNFKVQVVDTSSQFTFTLQDPLTRVIFWREKGLLLSLEDWRVDVDWQIVVGQEDAPYQGQGDSCDIILKLFKYTDSGRVGYQLAVYGEYIKKVWYGSTLLLDMSTGQRYAADYLPS